MTASASRFRTPGFPHSKFLQHSDHDWKFNNAFQYTLADGDCSKSEFVVEESERLCRETQERTEKHKLQVERKFDQRIADVNYWRQEGDKSIAKLEDSLDKLAHLKIRLKKAAENCKDPILACKKAMMERDKRLGVDMVQDKPQMEIQKYHILLEDVLAIFEKTIQEIEDQMISDRAAKQRLLRDVTDKQAALEIDTHASSCRPENKPSKGFKFDPDLMTPEKVSLTMADWERTTRHNIEKAEREVKNSRDFTPRTEEMLSRTYNDLTQQRLRVINALKDRLKELCDAQKNLEQRQARVQKQILDMEDTILKLDQAMERKYPSIELASNRMEGRRQRPRHELCRDSVDVELEEEVRYLSLSLHQLRKQKSEAQEMLRKLDQTRLALQKDIEVKKNSIYIDQEHCLNTFSNVSHIHH
ncbi:tektin-1-like [Argiope bruennichi]|uniref:Tektin n=1 Tax=Argiope bruennichi TaxID=94029 RepID=A0A8T0E650_ARGBR|nr:tektin-1-like [Argiope bruennichi]KAF8766392.1 Tektin-1 like protein [Argiope bruennichi]